MRSLRCNNIFQPASPRVMQQNISSYFVPLPLDNLNSSVRVQKKPRQDEENFLDIVHVPEKLVEYQYLQLLSNQDMVPTSTLYPPLEKKMKLNQQPI